MMAEPLDPIEVRVLGSLIEKERTTPDNYPLTLNALTGACNQTSNRDPVMKLEEGEVVKALDQLKRRALVGEVLRSDSRAKRYRHRMNEGFNLHDPEVAILGVLMLRGPQTLGEIRTRTERLFEFRDLAHVEVTLEGLLTMPTPLVAQLPRQPGQKEARYAHLLSGEPALDAVRVEADRSAVEVGRFTALEQELAALRAEVAELRAQLESFRREFQ